MKQEWVCYKSKQNFTENNDCCEFNAFILFCFSEVTAYTISKKWKGMMLLSRETRMGLRFVTNQNKILLKIEINTFILLCLFQVTACILAKCGLQSFQWLC